MELSLQPLNALGELLNYIIAEQIPPGAFQEIGTQLRRAQERLRSVNSAGVSDIVLTLEEAGARVGEALAAQSVARDGIAAYMASAGFVGTYKPYLRSLAGPRPDRSSVFQERPNSRDHFYAVGIDGAVRPCDILTNEVMFPDEIPEGLLLDEELREGFDFWIKHGDSVPFRLLLSAHHTEQDLLCAGIDLRREAQQLRSVQGVLFVECVAPRELSMGMQQLYNSASRSQSLEN